MLHQLPEISALRAGRLRHQHRGELLLGVHPEVRAGIAGPHELALRARDAAYAVALTHRKAQAEGVALVPSSSSPGCIGWLMNVPRWSEVMRRTVVRLRIRLPSSEPPFSIICEKRK